MDTKTREIVNVLANQRNVALDQVASLAGELAEARERIAELELKASAPAS